MSELRSAIYAELVSREIARRRIFRDKDIPYLVSLMTAVDARTGEEFTFEHVREPLDMSPGDPEVWLEGNTLRCRGWDGPSNQRGGQKTWRWQRYLLDRALEHKRTIDLKGRQIGDTWTRVALDVAKAIVFPGTTSLLFRQREDEAVDNARRWWILFKSLPPWVLERVPAGRKVGPVTVSKPDRGDRPGRDGVSLRFANGVFSDVVPMTSAAASGHGRSTRDIMLDEAAHIEKLLGIRAAVEPAAGDACIALISTANGRSNEETGEGNEFHRVWVQADDTGYHRVFLPYSLHPDRDEEWYETSPEVQSLPVWKRQEQFPRNETEAFALSDRVFFDPDGLAFYGEHVEAPKYRFDFEPNQFLQAKIVRHPKGRTRLFREPRPNRSYAIGADVASGRGRDFSAAYVVDLETMEWCAEYHAKVGEDLYAQDLHFLGRMFNTALIAPELQGGHGTAVIIALRDGAKGRPPYPKLYRHKNEGRHDRPDSKVFGMPMTPATRPLIVNQLEQHIRQRTLPFVPQELLDELSDFTHHDSGTSPRAREGAYDDRVMAAGITLELFRRFGKTVKRAAVRQKKQRKARVRAGVVDESRYPKLVRG